MSNRETNLKPDIVAEASAWFIEFRAGDITANARAKFHEWLRRSPEHIQAYIEVAAGWAELPTADPEGRLDIPALIKRARESQEENVVTVPQWTPARVHRRSLSVRAWAASLAGVAIIVGGAAWLTHYRANTFSTGVGEQRTVRLADGSMIELNALSTIRVRLSQQERDIDLAEGQALFHVAKDPARPFIVKSGATTVRAVGTQFDVYRRKSGTVVTVVEGRVAVAGPESSSLPPNQPASSLFLVAGEQVTMPAQLPPKEQPKPRRADVAVATAWVQKRLIFEETPLASVAEEFNRYSPRRLVILDPELKSVAISGVYSSADPDSLLGFLRTQPNIQLVESDQEIRISLREQK
jgi:transmembrane sensor